MSQASFDANAALRKLQSAGCTEPQAESCMPTKGDLYYALWIQGAVLAVLISIVTVAMLGFALFLRSTS